MNKLTDNQIWQCLSRSCTDGSAANFDQVCDCEAWPGMLAFAREVEAMIEVKQNDHTV